MSCSFDQPLRTDRVTAEATSVLWPIHLPAERGQERPKGSRRRVEGGGLMITPEEKWNKYFH